MPLLPVSLPSLTRDQEVEEHEGAEPIGEDDVIASGYCPWDDEDDDGEPGLVAGRFLSLNVLDAEGQPAAGVAYLLQTEAGERRGQTDLRAEGRVVRVPVMASGPRCSCPSTPKNPSST